MGCLRVECRKIEAFLFFWAISWLCHFSGLFIICLKLTTYSLDLRLLTQIENPFSWRVYKSIYIFPLIVMFDLLKKKMMFSFFCPLSLCYLLLYRQNHIFLFFCSADPESAPPASSIFVGLEFSIFKTILVPSYT